MHKGNKPLGPALDDIRPEYFDFESFGRPDEKALLSSPERWTWNAAFLPPCETKRHPRHEKWIHEKGNCHAPPHREVFLCLAGSTVMSRSGKVYEVPAGTAMMFDHREIHDLKAAPYLPRYRNLWLHFSARNLLSANISAQPYADNTYVDIPLRQMGGRKISLMMDTWDQCAQNPGPTLHWAFLRSCLTASFLEVLAHPLAVQSSKAERDLEIIQSIETYICTHLDENLDLRKVARVSGYSALYFRRLYLQHRKENLHTFITRQRLIHAMRLLQKGMTAEAVAVEIGISSPAYFTRFFKKHLFMPPSEWRLKNGPAMD